MTTKSVLSNNIEKSILNNNNLFNLVIFTECLHGCRNKSISKNTNNNKLFTLVIATKCLCNYKSKHINKKSEGNKSKSKVIIVFLAPLLKV